MRFMLIIMCAFTAIVCIGQTAEAQNGGWCAYYNGGGMGGARNCGFATFQQCQAAVSGVGGNCSPSPYSSSPGRHQSTRYRPSYY
jgi:hypothetical protein